MPENNEHKGILIYAQLTREEFIHTVFFELVDKAKELAQKLGGVEVNAVIFTRKNLVYTYKEAFENKGLNKVYYFEDDSFKNYNTETYSKLIINLINQIKPEIMLIGATNQGRDLAPRIASALGTGLTADCTGLDINENGRLAATRPTFGGQLMATILCKTFPQMATVRPKVFKTNPETNFVQTEMIQCPINIDITSPKYKFSILKRLLKTKLTTLILRKLL